MKKMLAVGLVICWGASFLWSLSTAVRTHWRVFQMGKKLDDLKASDHQSLQKISQQKLEAEVNRVASKGSLLSLNVAERNHRCHVEMEWEGPISESLVILDEFNRKGLMGTIPKMSVRRGAKNPSHLRMELAFTAPSVLPPGQSTPMPLPRRAFRAEAFGVREFVPVVVRMSPQEEKRRQQKLAKEMEDKRRQEVEQYKQAKRAEYESNFTVSGIVNNGREALALVVQRSSGATLMLRKGEFLQEARVTNVDEGKREVLLSIPDIAPIVLRAQP